jgi:hypothetical protein
MVAEATVALTQVVHKKAGSVKCGAAVHLMIAEATVALPSGSQESWQGEMWRYCSHFDCRGGDSCLTKWFTKKLAGWNVAKLFNFWLLRRQLPYLVVQKKAGSVQWGAAVQLLIAEATVSLQSGSQKSRQCEMWRCCSLSDCRGDSNLNEVAQKKPAGWNVALLFTFWLPRWQWP